MRYYESIAYQFQIIISFSNPRPPSITPKAPVRKPTIMSSGATASEQLIGAVRGNNEQLAEELLKGKSPTVVAATINSTRDPVGNTLLHIGAAAGSYDALDFLLDQEGVEVDPLTKINRDTPLHLAAKISDPAVAKAVVELLVECGADPLLRNADNKRPIQLATDAEVVQVLRSAQYAAELTNAAPTAQDVDGVALDEGDDGESDNEID